MAGQVSLEAIEAEAAREVREEERRRLVDLAKERIRARMGEPWGKRLIPFTITINWR